MVYEYLYRQIDDKKVRATIDFLLNREEAHNQMFRDAFNEVQVGYLHKKAQSILQSMLWALLLGQLWHCLQAAFSA